MKIKDLIQELSKYNQETEIGVVVSYTRHFCDGVYCYCSEKDYEYPSLTLVKQEIKGKNKNKGKIFEKIWIRGDE